MIIHAFEMSPLDNGEAIMDFDIDFLLSVLNGDDHHQYATSTAEAAADETHVDLNEISRDGRYGTQLSNHDINVSAASPKATTKANMPSSGRRRTNEFTCKGFKRQFAKHNYHDRSTVRPEDIVNDELCHQLKSGVPTSFPSLFHEMLENADALGYSDIVSWQPHGRAFHIHDRKRFAQAILPRYFHHQKISSFQRQLSLYGFTRLTRDGSWSLLPRILPARSFFPLREASTQAREGHVGAQVSFTRLGTRFLCDESSR